MGYRERFHRVLQPVDKTLQIIAHGVLDRYGAIVGTPDSSRFVRKAIDDTGTIMGGIAAYERVCEKLGKLQMKKLNIPTPDEFQKIVATCVYAVGGIAELLITLIMNNPELAIKVHHAKFVGADDWSDWNATDKYNAGGGVTTTVRGPGMSERAQEVHDRAESGPQGGL